MSKPNPVTRNRTHGSASKGVASAGSSGKGQAVKMPDAVASRFPLDLSQVNSAASAGPGKPLLRPQLHLHQAQQQSEQAARQGMPRGLGMDSASIRANMVARLRVEGIADERVLSAFSQVPRHAFVDTALVGQAYEDTSLPIGLGQTISKPSVVARMLSLLLQGAQAQRAGHLGRVLEVGTGCGYQAALLAGLADSVVSIERLGALHERACRRLLPAHADSLLLLHGDGLLGHRSGAPYDSIIAAAGGDQLPQAWLDQLGPGGRLVAPLRDTGSTQQVLIVVDRRVDGTLTTHKQELVHFVPLKSGVA